MRISTRCAASPACREDAGRRRLAALKRILVIALAGIGDTLMATPVIHELREQFPTARLEALVMWPGARELLELNPHLDAVHQHSLIDAPKISSLRFVLGLRRRRFDLSLNLHPQGRRAYRVIARLIGARERLSHRYENYNVLDSLLITRSLPQDYAVHCVTNNLRLLGLIGLTPRLPRHEYELFLSPEERVRGLQVAGELGLVGRRWLGMHVGSGGTKNLALRRWPVANYVELIGRLREQLPDVPVVLFGGPGERAAHEEIRRAVGEAVLEPKTPNLRAAAALLEHARAFLSVDTVFMHLAAAMHVPRQLVIETPTLNPPVCPKRNDWTLIPNPAVGGRHLDFYRYDGRPIAGSAEEIERLMRAVTVGAVFEACRAAL